jgi:Tol biopolymer transport system component/DNA-binding winged helix-turn-helix (wHTH) protein
LLSRIFVLSDKERQSPACHFGITSTSPELVAVLGEALQLSHNWTSKPQQHWYYYPLLTISSIQNDIAPGSTPASGGAFRLKGWFVDPINHALTRDNEEIILAAKVMAVLEHVARNHERLVTREELIDSIWDGNSYVGEKALNNAIWRIRRALNDKSGDFEIIRTVPKTGYQLQATPVYLGEVSAETADESIAAKKQRLFTGFAVVIVTIAAITLGALYFDAGPEEVRPTVLVDMPGRELYPTVATDGSAIAFLSVSLNNERNVFLKWLDGRVNSVQQLTYSALDEINPTWSPDSVHIAFLRSDPATEQCDVIAMNTHTNMETVIAPCEFSESVFRALAWSPDGQWLLFPSTNGEVGPGLYLWPVSADGSVRGDAEPRRISCVSCNFVDQEVSWSPDSRKIAISRRSNRLSENIHVYDIDTAEFRELTADEQSIKGHAWFRDGRQLIYVSDRGPRHRRLWLLDTQTGARREIGVDGAGYPAFTADYQSIVLHRRDANTHVASLRLGTGNAPRQSLIPVIQTANTEHSPAFDPNSNRIAFVSDKSGHDEIWLANADGTNSKQLTEVRGSVLDPTWSPDGQVLAFVSYLAEDRSNVVMYVDVESGRLRAVPTGFDDHGPPSWSSDNRSLIVPIITAGRADLWRFSLDGESRTQLTTDGGEFGREGPDGSSLYYTKPGRDGLYCLCADGIESVVFEDFGSRSGWGNWDWLSQNELLFSISDNGRMFLSKLDLRTSSSTEVVEFPSRTIHRSGRLSYAVANDTVYFTQRELPQIDIWIMPNPVE